MKAAEIAEETGVNADEAAVEESSASASQPATHNPFGSPTSSAANNSWSQTTPRNVLYVGNIFFESTEDDLQQFFKEFGNIESVRIVRDQRGMSKG